MSIGIHNPWRNMEQRPGLGGMNSPEAIAYNEDHLIDIAEQNRRAEEMQRDYEVRMKTGKP